MLRIDQPESMRALLGKRSTIKPPAYEWQDRALRIIDELGIPPKKRNAVFRVCKQHPKRVIEKALNDTKELVKEGERWRYFFKVIENKEWKAPPLSQPLSNGGERGVLKKTP